MENHTFLSEKRYTVLGIHVDFLTYLSLFLFDIKH